MATIKDDRTDEEVRNTIGFVVATDSFMSGWGDAPGKSIVAVPVINDKDRQRVEVVMSRRSEMKRLRFAYGSNYKPKLGKDDHLHIYNTNTSFRRCPTCSGVVTFTEPYQWAKCGCNA
tara:strand:- start:404 stop:757 length:354 start_codon:yes stop_codon:yes gene_type:complete